MEQYLLQELKNEILGKITRVLKNEGINKFKDSLGTEEEIINYGKIMGIQINESTTIDQICQNLSSLTLSSSKPAMNNNYSNVNLVQIAEYRKEKFRKSSFNRPRNTSTC